MKTTAYYIRHNGKKTGPLTAATLSDMSAAGTIYDTMEIGRDGVSGWAAAGSVKGLRAVPEPPTPRQAAYAKDLGITVRAGMTRDELSAKMDAALGRAYKTGRFVRLSQPVKVAGHVTTERTGNGLKAEWLVSWVMFAASLAACVAGAGDSTAAPTYAAAGVAGLLLSLVYGLLLRFRMWWSHG